MHTCWKGANSLRRLETPWLSVLGSTVQLVVGKGLIRFGGLKHSQGWKYKGATAGVGKGLIRFGGLKPTTGGGCVPTTGNVGKGLIRFGGLKLTFFGCLTLWTTSGLERG